MKKLLLLFTSLLLLLPISCSKEEEVKNEKTYTFVSRIDPKDNEVIRITLFEKDAEGSGVRTHNFDRVDGSLNETVKASPKAVKVMVEVIIEHYLGSYDYVLYRDFLWMPSVYDVVDGMTLRLEDRNSLQREKPTI